MSTFQTQRGTLKTAGTILTGTSATTILAAADEAQLVEFIQITEVAGSTPTVIIDIYDGAAVVAKIRGTLATTAYGSARIDGPFMLEPGWSLRATAGTGNQVHCLVTYSTTPV